MFLALKNQIDDFRKNNGAVQIFKSRKICLSWAAFPLSIQRLKKIAIKCFTKCFTSVNESAIYNQVLHFRIEHDETPGTKYPNKI